MKIIKSMLILAIIAMTNIGYANNTNTLNLKEVKYKYFYNLPFRESPYMPFKGIYKTSKGKAQKRNHYRFGYDKKGRIIELSLMRNNRLVVNINSNNFFMGVAKIEFKYKNNTQILTYFNYKNEQTAFYNVWKSIFIRDKNGKNKELVHYDKSGNVVNNHWGISRYVWETDNKGRIKEQRFDIKGNQAMVRPRFDFYEIRMTFDSRGYLKRMDNYGKKGVLTNNSLGVATDKLKYDKNGNFTQWKVFNAKGKAVIGNLPGTAGGNHYYNNYGDQIKTEVFDLNDNLMIGNWGYAYIEKDFSKAGNIIAQRRYDANKKIMTMGPKIHSIGFNHNEINLLTEVKYLDKDGRKVVEQRQGIAQAKYVYDENYNMIQRKYFDDKGNLTINRMRGYALEKYKHYSNSKKVDSLRYDASMKLIKKAN